MASYTTILIDIEKEMFRFMGYDDSQGANYQTATKSFRFSGFDEEFLKTYGAFLQEIAHSHPSFMQGNITVVLPDSVVFTDVLTLPVTRGMLTGKSNLNAALSSTYPNLKELTVRSYNAVTTKTTVTTCLYGVQNKIVSGIRTVHQTQKYPLGAVTFASGATLNGILTLNSKLKNGTFLFLDIKETSARYLYVYKGRLVGSFNLPFGFGVLSANRIESENMLFDHDIAELEVLNAKEKAKAKALTVMETPQNDENGEAEEDDLFRDDNKNTEGEASKAVKFLPKKMSRKLPKFMTREVENTPEAVTYENFRLFMKWSLDLLQSNPQPANPGECNTIYVNFPDRYDYLLEKANEEQKDVSPVVFRSAELNKEKEAVVRNLELYGGFFARKIANAPNL